MSSRKASAMRLGDAELLKFCVANINQLSFLNTASTGALQRLAETPEAKDGSSDFLDGQKEIEDLWVQLFIDAIHALKIRDKREKAGQQEFDRRPETEQQAARSQNVFGISQLRSYFRDFTDFESVLYGIERSYRDHVAHVIRVWLIGVCLLVKQAPNDKLAIDHLLMDIPLPPSKSSDPHLGAAASITTQERWAMWTVVALGHDLGYPLEKTRKVNDVVDRMLRHFGDVSTSRYRYSFQGQHQFLNDVTLRVLSSRLELLKIPVPIGNADAICEAKYTTLVQPKYHTKFAHSLEDFHHGVISCLVLMKTLVYFKETDYDTGSALGLEDARQFYIRSHMLRAVASHTCPDIYHLRISTLSFVLILCDELQEWGRPTFREMKLGLGQASGASEVVVNECDFSKGSFRARLKYKGGPLDEKQVLSKFETFHRLLRAAIDDKKRDLKFGWEITGDRSYVFEYDSRRGPFQEMSLSRDGEPITSLLYGRDSAPQVPTA